MIQPVEQKMEEGLTKQEEEEALAEALEQKEFERRLWASFERVDTKKNWRTIAVMLFCLTMLPGIIQFFAGLIFFGYVAYLSSCVFLNTNLTQELEKLGYKRSLTPKAEEQAAKLSQ